eukprot:3495305-Rhodomonas_salina.1
MAGDTNTECLIRLRTRCRSRSMAACGLMMGTCEVRHRQRERARASCKHTCSPRSRWGTLSSCCGHQDHVLAERGVGGGVGSGRVRREERTLNGERGSTGRKDTGQGLVDTSQGLVDTG